MPIQPLSLCPLLALLCVQDGSSPAAAALVAPLAKPASSCTRRRQSPAQHLLLLPPQILHASALGEIDCSIGRAALVPQACSATVCQTERSAELAFVSTRARLWLRSVCYLALAYTCIRAVTYAVGPWC